MRKLIIEAILKRAGTINPQSVLAESLKWLSDTNLIAFAIDLGIDTNDVLLKGVQS